MSKYVDMARTPKEEAESVKPISLGMDKYPYGLCISLCKDELEKLEVDHTDVEVGDFLHVHALAKVTSKSNHENENGENPRLELTLAFMEIEDEGLEDEEEEDEEPKGIMKRLYR